jgi:hypothetical protein
MRTRRQRLIAVVALVTITIELLIPLRGVHALFGVGDTVFTIGDLPRYLELVANGVKYVAKTAILAAIRASLVNFVNTGRFQQTDRFGKRTSLITSFKRELLDAADLAASSWLEAALPEHTDICSPFRLSLGALMRESIDFPDDDDGIPRARCSLSEAIDIQRGGLERFYKDFRDGGWDAWIVHNRPENTLLGTWILADDDLIRRTRNEISGKELETQTGGGYVGVKVCIDFFDDGRKCKEYQTVTPGTLVADQVNRLFAADIDNFLAADTWHELLIGLSDVLIARLFQVGLSKLQGVVSGSPGGGDGGDVGSGADPNGGGGPGGVGSTCGGPSDAQCNAGLECQPMPLAPADSQKFCQEPLKEGDVCKLGQGSTETSVGTCGTGLQCLPASTEEGASVFTCSTGPGTAGLYGRCSLAQYNVPSNLKCDSTQGLTCKRSGLLGDICRKISGPNVSCTEDLECASAKCQFNVCQP